MPEKPTMSANRLTRLFLAANVAALLAMACWYRCRELGHIPGLNGDEAWYGVQALALVDRGEIAWRTPTNNLLNWFYFGPLAALHLAFEPSFALLRVPAVASSLLALLVNFVLCRRLVGCKAGDVCSAPWVSTLLLAVLPVNIAYSRFGWDASQSLLFTLPVVYCSLLSLCEPPRRSRWLVLGAISLIAAMYVHPTNIFAAPILAVAAVWPLRGQLRHTMQSQAIRKRGLAVLAATVLLSSATGWMARHWILRAAERVVQPSQAAEFAWHYQRLLSGVTVYRYIAGSGGLHDGPSSRHALGGVGKGGNDALDWNLLDLATLLVACVAAAGLFAANRSTVGVQAIACSPSLPPEAGTPIDRSSIQARRASECIVWEICTRWRVELVDRSHRLSPVLHDRSSNRVCHSSLDRCLLAGWGLSLLGFFLVAGPGAIAPHYERYGIVLVAPAALLLARGLSWWITRLPLARFTSLALAWLVLLDFDAQYFRFIRCTGGRSHAAFRTADPEPKQAALGYVLARRNPNEETSLAMSQWWNRLPIQYLAMREKNVRIVDWTSFWPRADRGTVWFIEFAGSPECHELEGRLVAEGIRYDKTVLHDFAGRDLMAVIGPVHSPAP
jgi:hypothetical protein